MVVVFRSFFFPREGFANYNYDDPKRINGTIETFMLSSGFDERLYLGVFEPVRLEFPGWAGLVSGGFFVVVDWLTRGIVVILMVYPP